MHTSPSSSSLFVARLFGTAVDNFGAVTFAPMADRDFGDDPRDIVDESTNTLQALFQAVFVIIFEVSLS